MFSFDDGLLLIVPRRLRVCFEYMEVNAWIYDVFSFSNRRAPHSPIGNPTRSIVCFNQTRPLKLSEVTLVQSYDVRSDFIVLFRLDHLALSHVVTDDVDTRHFQNTAVVHAEGIGRC